MPRCPAAIKKLALHLVLAVMIPALLLAAAEAVLRGFNIGYPTSFVVSGRVGDTPAWVNNPFFGYRFFPPELARNPPLLACPRAKAEGTVRVVVLGESAAMGDPVSQFSAPRMLEKMLNHGGEPPRFEVINTAMTAINSLVIADVASELDRLQPDIVILYIGNNEVVGPFGPGTMLTRRGWAWLTPLRVRLSRLRLGQVLRSVQRALAGNRAGHRDFGMQLFDANRMRADDSRLAGMYGLYENRMERIMKYAREAGAEILLCTMAVNLTDCAPFGSEHRSGMDSAARQAWDPDYEQGCCAQQQNRHEDALRHFDSAAERDDCYAELAYRRAQVLTALGRAGEALPLFALARDLDTQRFRADSRINRILRELACRRAAILVDAESSFAAGPDPAALFLDHVHFTFEGAYRLAGLWFEALAERYPGRVMPSVDECKDRMMFTAWGEGHQAIVMHGRRGMKPFAEQLDNERHREALAERIQQSEALIESTPLDRIRALYEQNRRLHPNDLLYPVQWATVLMVVGQTEEALTILAGEAERLPHHFEWRIMPAYLLAKSGEPERAAGLLLGEGPPYGHFLADHVEGVMRSLEADGLHEQARRMGEEILQRQKRFSGRDRLAARVARTKR